MTAASLPDQPHTTTPASAPCHGPYEQAPEDFVTPDRRAAMFQAALQGVALGGWDRRVLTHLANWCDTPTVLAILGWIQRARRAAQASHTPACQREASRAVDTGRLAMTDALTEARRTARLLLDHLAAHLDQPPAGLPAWIYTRAGDDDQPQPPTTDPARPDQAHHAAGRAEP